MARKTLARKLAAGAYIYLALTVVVLGATAAWAAFSKNTSATGSVSTGSVAAPTGLTATGGTGVQLSWTASTSAFATGTRVLRGTASGGPYSQIAQTAATSYTDNPTAGTYYYVVEAYYTGNGANWISANSAQASAAVVVITFVQAASGNGTNPAVTATFATTPVAGHLLIAAAATRNDGVLTGPAGWSTAINLSNLGNSGPDEAIFYKTAGASEPTTVSVTTAAGGNGNGLSIYEYAGVTTLEGTNAASGSGTTATTGSFTTTSAAALVVADLVSKSTSAFGAFSNGFTSRTNVVTGGTHTALVGGDLITSSTGSYSTSATANSAGWQGEIAAFK